MQLRVIIATAAKKWITAILARRGSVEMTLVTLIVGIRDIDSTERCYYSCPILPVLISPCISDKCLAR